MTCGLYDGSVNVDCHLQSETLANVALGSVLQYRPHEPLNSVQAREAMCGSEMNKRASGAYLVVIPDVCVENSGVATAREAEHA